MKAIGITCGIGSMLIGARSAGFKITGNVEWRPYYHSGTFEENFPDSYMVRKMKDAFHPGHVELAMGHPECGNYSQLRTNVCKYDDPGDLPLFIELIKWAKPEFFVMDNLPRSLIAVPIMRYADELTEYDLFPEWVSNYHYGNVQLNRRRFFLIGAKKSQKFRFVPGEFSNQKVLIDVIRDLPPHRNIFDLNHVHRRDDEIIPTGWAAHQFGIKREGNKITYGEMKGFIRDWPCNKNFTYLNFAGERKIRPGYFKIKLDHTAPVMSGGGSALDNHYRADTLLPLTTRERARIQGCPDSFLFYPMDHLLHPKWSNHVYKQVGKFMPVEFCTFVAAQIMAHLKGKTFTASGSRLVKPSPFVDAAKTEYCFRRGHRREWCEVCWMDPCPVRGKNPSYIPPLTAQAHAGTVPGTPRRGKPAPRPEKRAPGKPADAPKTPLQRARAASETKRTGKTKGNMATKKARIFSNFDEKGDADGYRNC